MSKSAVIGAVFGIAVATAVAGIAGYSLSDRDTAPVAAEEQNAVSQVCYEAQVEQTAIPRDEHRITGTVIGTLIGGAVGKDIGDRDVTTVAGAALGAVAGSQVQKNIQESRTITSTEVRCEPATINP